LCTDGSGARLCRPEGAAVFNASRRHPHTCAGHEWLRKNIVRVKVFAGNGNHGGPCFVALWTAAPCKDLKNGGRHRRQALRWRLRRRLMACRRPLGRPPPLPIKLAPPGAPTSPSHPGHGPASAASSVGPRRQKPRQNCMLAIFGSFK